jgi:hypothetical protein
MSEREQTIVPGHWGVMSFADDRNTVMRPRLKA